MHTQMPFHSNDANPKGDVPPGTIHEHAHPSRMRTSPPWLQEDHLQYEYQHYV